MCLRAALLLATCAGCGAPYAPDVVDATRSSAQSSAHSPAPKREAAATAKADPVADVAIAIRSGDKRFLAVMEVGEYFPGVESRPDVVEKFGHTVIVGTSCISPFEEAAIEYAAVYNTILLRHLSQMGELPNP